eukprot:SAG31_NODE_10_length_40133_cov_27.863041_35_plen_244_part_00
MIETKATDSDRGRQNEAEQYFDQPDQETALKLASFARITRRLRQALDGAIVGQTEAKQAVLLAIICREHVYIEGPPGVAKTLTAEVAARATEQSVFFYQFHRDTRVGELVGETVIFREQHGGQPAAEAIDDPASSEVDAANMDAPMHGEVIRQLIRPGGVAKAEFCIFDDISRAPGEALNVLLRLLNERVFDGAAIPLMTAVATANPTRDECAVATTIPCALRENKTMCCSAATLSSSLTLPI